MPVIHLQELLQTVTAFSKLQSMGRASVHSFFILIFPWLLFRARVLKGERTIRMHYANCATFNADFDGDEINLHLPQDQYGRAEGYGIVHADQQFIVPTDGKPIRGLIQDHVVGGVMLTKRDCFLTKTQFTQLLYNACRRWSAGKGK